jgi:hypothetical protein
VQTSADDDQIEWLVCKCRQVSKHRRESAGKWEKNLVWGSKPRAIEAAP